MSVNVNCACCSFLPEWAPLSFTFIEWKVTRSVQRSAKIWTRSVNVVHWTRSCTTLLNSYNEWLIFSHSNCIILSIAQFKKKIYPSFSLYFWCENSLKMQDMRTFHSFFAELVLLVHIGKVIKNMVRLWLSSASLHYPIGSRDCLQLSSGTWTSELQVWLSRMSIIGDSRRSKQKPQSSWCQKGRRWESWLERYGRACRAASGNGNYRPSLSHRAPEAGTEETGAAAERLGSDGEGQCPWSQGRS